MLMLLFQVQINASKIHKNLELLEVTITFSIVVV